MHRKFYFIITALIVVTSVSIFFSKEIAAPEIKNVADLRSENIPRETASAVSDTVTINITFKVGNSVYTTEIPAGFSIYDAMKKLASTSSFRFVSKEYPSLGYFIEEINGTRNADGAYWTLYVNGVFSSVGASGYSLQEGDVIEWKYEKK